MSTPLTLVAAITDENGKPVIHLYPEEDPFYLEVLRSHDDVEKHCAWLRDRARVAWGKDLRTARIAWDENHSKNDE